MLIKNLPKEIQILVRQEQERQGISGTALELNRNMADASVLNWSKALDGREFWQDISNGYFADFYRKYPDAKEKLLREEREELKVIEDEVFNFFKS